MACRPSWTVGSTEQCRLAQQPQGLCFHDSLPYPQTYPLPDSTYVHAPNTLGLTWSAAVRARTARPIPARSPSITTAVRFQSCAHRANARRTIDAPPAPRPGKVSAACLPQPRSLLDPIVDRWDAFADVPSETGSNPAERASWRSLPRIPFLPVLPRLLARAPFGRTRPSMRDTVLRPARSVNHPHASGRGVNHCGDLWRR